MKRFEAKDRDATTGTRSGPRARAAQDRKFGEKRSMSRDSSRADPYQRADRPARPPRPGADGAAPYSARGRGERLRVPARGSITLDPDVARVFRDSEAVNEALRLVIRLARSVGAGGRDGAGRSGAPPRPRSGSAPSGPRYSRDERPRPGRGSSPAAPGNPRFEEPD